MFLSGCSMSNEILVFLFTGIVSGFVGWYGLWHATPFLWKNGSHRAAFGALIASLYFSWVAIVYGSVVIGLNTPTGYSVLVRPLFNLLLAAFFLVLSGIVEYMRRKGK